ncbi:hypothetical protein Tsubulata_018888 [Turnera subulata]|uniref:Pentacotripeptide-repeat region of PRORP domain-containing protein n=1 Tax=Turnera subulata TaxID=218843 RepID=A0A9Q0JGB4_9ROSI|nr:hypothetical protein Tsubulata_018888 [Turnera subulata]
MIANSTHLVADLFGGLITIQHAIADAGELVKLLLADYPKMVHGLCQTWQSSVAVGLLLRMLEVGYYPHRLNYAKLVESLCKDGKVDEALDIVSKLVRDKGLIPASFTCNNLIRALCDDGQCDRALDFLDELLALRVYPDEFAYDILLDALLKEGGRYSQRAELVLARHQNRIFALLNNGYKPDSCTYTNLVDGYLKTGMINEAEQLLDAMSQIGLVPDNVVCNSVLGGLLSNHINENGNAPVIQ